MQIPEPTNLRISTHTATCNINSTINLQLVAKYLEISDKIVYLEYGDIQKGINPKKFSVLNLSKLSEFKDNETVNLDSLIKKGLIFKPKYPLKILGTGEINSKLKVQAHAFTKIAKQKIENAGGSCELVNK